jgi:hypothetical protein
LYGNHEGDRHVLAADLIAKAHVIPKHKEEATDDIREKGERG